MQLLDAGVVLIVFAISCLLTLVLRRRALSKGMLDVPNSRSSHSVPTPRGGGLAIVVAAELAAAYLWVRGQITPGLFAVLFLGGGAVAAIGYADDARGLKARTRFIVHLLAATGAVVLLGGAALGTAVLPAFPAAVGLLVLVLAACWSVNLFNFMDGIDGIAASEFVFVCLAAAGLMVISRGFDGTASLLVLLAAATAGFLVWNWAPAKIFMGDVGSGFLGYLIAVLALYCSSIEGLSIWTWMILYSIFVADSTVTLMRRMVNGARWYEAHRSHAYQHLSRRWNSHSRVCWAMGAVNVLLVAPLAYLSDRFPQYGMSMALALLGCWGLLFWLLSAGKPSGKSH